MKSFRRYPMGAEVSSEGTHFRVWAPARRAVIVELETPGDVQTLALAPEGDGYFQGMAPGVGAGTNYRFRLDDDATPYPDPASRYQPSGPHGPSQVVDPTTFEWTDQAWPGLTAHSHVLYEMHVGTFTPAGTWAAAAEKLPYLADLGITVVEMMPVADFPGEFGWGYDGVNWFAPTRLYGSPDDLRRFIDRAHRLKLGVVLDVVYNHLGPDGNYLSSFAKDYFTDRYSTDWGAAIHYEGPEAVPVREYVTANAAYWIDEFHFDGLRLDATQNIYDASPKHILRELTEAARRAAGSRKIFMVAENEPQNVQLVRDPQVGGFGIDALWNDDLHHAARVACTGQYEAYYTDYRGEPQEFISALKRGYLYQGQWYSWQKARRGTPALELDRCRFVSFLENHDQVANSGTGLHRHAGAHPGAFRALTGMILLGTGHVMLFQGQEFGALEPFHFFADHRKDLAKLVAAGRKEFLRQFPSYATDAVQRQLADPADRTTFELSKLNWDECERHAAKLALHRDLLALRRNDPVLADECVRLDGAVLGEGAFLIRFFNEEHGDRLLLMNLGRDVVRPAIPEPLFAEPAGCEWRTAWSSDDPKYGGTGVRAIESEAGWRIPGYSAMLLLPEQRGES